MKRWILFLMLTTSLYAQSKDILGVRISEEPRLDGWSVCHFFKGALTYETLKMLGVKPKDATTGAIAFAILYEILFDGLQKPVFGMEPDPKGADIADVFFDTLGVYCTRVLHILLKNERAVLSYNNRELTLSLAF